MLAPPATVNAPVVVELESVVVLRANVPIDKTVAVVTAG